MYCEYRSKTLLHQSLKQNLNETRGVPRRLLLGGPKLIVWPTQKIDPGQLVIVILLEPFHH